MHVLRNMALNEKKLSLPSAFDLLNSELTKASWKQTIDEHINTYWVNKIKLEASDKVFEY